MSCTGTTLPGEQWCMTCIPPAVHLEIQTYLLATIAGQSTDPNVLLEQSKLFRFLPPAILSWIKTYLLCLLGIAGCVKPTAPTGLTVDSEIPNEVTFSWSYGTDPTLDFLAALSSTPGGPYTNAGTFLASARSGTLFPEDSGTFYLVIYARNSSSCVSDASNEVAIHV